MQKVIVATPSQNGLFPAEYMDSLLRTVEAGREKNIQFLPLFIAYDALIQRIRNDLFKKIYYSDADINEIIFIDADMTWEPKNIFSLLSFKEDVVSALPRKKSDTVSYPFTPLSLPLSLSSNGLLPLESIGLAFIKMTRKVINALWENSLEYRDDKNEENRMVFSVEVNEKGYLVSEDITVSRKIRNLGFNIWGDISISIGHIGKKIFYSDFPTFMEQMSNSQ